MKHPILAFAAGLATIAAACPLAASAAPISLDVRDLDIYDAVRLLSTQGAVNVVVDSSVPHHPVTLRLVNVTFDQALATLAQSNDLESARVGNVIYLGPGEVINRRYPPGAATGTRTRVFAVKNASPDDVARGLNEALPHGTVVVADRRTSTIVVSGSATALSRAHGLVSAFDQSAGLQNASLDMRYVRASDALHALQATLQIQAPSSAYASDVQNAIILTGSADFIAQAGAIVARIDRPGQQVRYEVRVTDISPSEASNVGLLFGGVDVSGNPMPGSGSTVTTFVNNTLRINATINALVSKGDATILARPSLSTLNNVQASLLVGQQYPIVYFDARTGTQQVQFINVGVNLNVTPTIGADGAITTDLETDYSQVTGSISNFPIVGTRKAQSTLRVRDGETIVIAGLFSDVDASTVSKVPFLGDIPVIGEIFKNRQRSHSKDEVVFLITPHLVADGEASKTSQR